MMANMKSSKMRTSLAIFLPPRRLREIKTKIWKNTQTIEMRAYKFLIVFRILNNVNFSFIQKVLTHAHKK
jgi:hypothetical protein